MKKEDELFYIGIEDPQELRRYVLESSRSVVLNLKRFEEINATRIRKMESMAKFKDIVEEINAMVSKLRRELPKTKVTTLRKVRLTEERPPELDELESELNVIESHLKKLE